MTTCVAFDIGNLLCHFYIDQFTKKLALITKISDKDAFFFVEYLQRFQDNGLCSMRQALRLNYDLHDDQLQELVDTWNAAVVPSEVMLNFMDTLRSEGIKIALLSNMGPEHITYLRSTCPRLFENTIQHISCEVGARKPTKLFFQSFVLDNGEFRGCVYLDDIEENLRMGKKYSFKCYRFDLEESTRAGLAAQKQELDRIKRMIIDKN